MKVPSITLVLFIFVNILVSAGGANEGPGTAIVPESATLMPAEKLETEDKEPEVFLHTYPETNIYNALGSKSVKSGFPEAIFKVFDELSSNYDPIIVYYEFIPYQEDIPASTAITQSTSGAGAVSQELITDARDHLGLADYYEILETYDPTMANIIVMVECLRKDNKVTEKISMTFYNFNYRLITPSDQIVIGKNNASIIRENYYDPKSREIDENTLADIWY